MNDFENEVLIRLFGELHLAVEKLKNLSQTSQETFLRSFEKTDSAKYNFIVAVEAAIDICNHLIASRSLGTPEEYADIFRVMKEAGAFDDEFTEKLVQMARFRNLLVHRYWMVDDRQVYRILQEELGDFKLFEDAIRAYLRSEGRESFPN